jgi:multiple sugar transport system substrate-binding protein
MPNALTFAPVYGFGIKDPNFVLGPKIPKANEYHSIIASQTQRMLAGELTAAETGAELKSQLDALNEG